MNIIKDFVLTLITKKYFVTQLSHKILVIKNIWIYKIAIFILK